MTVDKRSSEVFDPFLVACCCILLAAKAEETPRRLRDVINVAHCVKTGSTEPLQADSVRTVPAITAVGETHLFASFHTNRNIGTSRIS